MGLQFVIGGSGSGKSHYVHHYMVEEARLHPKKQFFILVPDQFTMQTQKDLVLTHSKGIMNIDVLSFGRLSHRLFEENGGDDMPVLDDTGKSLILRKVAGENKEKLPVIGAHLKKTGYIHEVKSALSEFYQYGIDVTKMEEMIAFANGKNALRDKLKDLASIYQIFQKNIEEKFITKEEILDLASRQVLKSCLLRNSVIILDGFTGFTPVQMRFLEQLFLVCEKVMVTVTMDPLEDLSKEYEDQYLFSMSRKMMDALVRLAKNTDFALEDRVLMPATPVFRYQNDRELAFLEQELFRYRSKSFADVTNSVKIWEAENPRQEIKGVLRHVKRLVCEQGYQYRDFALITGALSDYEYFIEEECKKMEIPLYMDRTAKLSGNPGMDFVVSAMQVVLSDFAYEDLFHFLRNQMSGFSEDEIDKLENYCLQKGIRSRTKYERMFTGKPTDTTLFEERLMELNQIREKIVAMFAPIRKKKKSVRSYVENIYQFMVENELEEKLKACADDFTEKNELSKALEYSQVYREIIELLDQFVSLLGEEEMTFQEFIEILKAGFDECKVGTLPQNVDRFVAGDMERTRLSNIKVLFFVGVNDGTIPKKGGNSGIINDIDREFLVTGDFEMAPSPRQKMYIQRFYLYLNMTKPSKELVLSYVRTNAEGKNVRPSYLIDTVKRLYPKLQVHALADSEKTEDILSVSDGREIFTDQIREYAAGRLKETRVLYSLMDVFTKDEELSEYALKMTKAAFYRYEGLPMRKEVVKALYGAVLYGSVSRFETFSQCAYRYFLQYGLKLKEREEYQFEAKDLGTIFHQVMHTFSNELKKEKLNWFDFSKEAGERIIEKAVDEAAAGFGDTVLYSTARQEYAITKMKRIMKRTVDTLQFQLKQGSFMPSDFELEFQSMDDKSLNMDLKNGQKLKLQGRIDRMDLYEDQDSVYVKVIDYKSGNKDFDLSELYYGRQLQLVVYMNAALSEVKKRFPDKQALPAGLMYYSMKDPFVDRDPLMDTKEAITEQIRKNLRPKGIILAKDIVVDALDHGFEKASMVIPVERKKDGSFTSSSDVYTKEQMDLISEYVTHKIKGFGEAIMGGVVKRNPCTMGTTTSCDFCAFKGKCGLDTKLLGEELTELKSYKDDEVLELMQKDLSKE